MYKINVESTHECICFKVQATVVGALAAFAAVTMGWVLDGEFNIHHATLLCASSLVTASLASFILGSVMVAVVLCSRKCSINPDNVATPIAASLGDLTTLALLSAISRFLHSCIGKFQIKCYICSSHPLSHTCIYTDAPHKEPLFRNMLTRLILRKEKLVSITLICLFQVLVWFQVLV